MKQVDKEEFDKLEIYTKNSHIKKNHLVFILKHKSGSWYIGKTQTYNQEIRSPSNEAFCVEYFYYVATDERAEFVVNTLVHWNWNNPNLINDTYRNRIGQTFTKKPITETMSTKTFLTFPRRYYFSKKHFKDRIELFNEASTKPVKGHGGQYNMVYIIRHTSGAFYIGIRQDDKPDAVLKTYFTSSNNVHKIMDVDGQDSFKVEKIFYMKTAAKAALLEAYLIMINEPETNIGILNLAYNMNNETVINEWKYRNYKTTNLCLNPDHIVFESESRNIQITYPYFFLKPVTTNPHVGVIKRVVPTKKTSTLQNTIKSLNLPGINQKLCYNK